MLIATLPAVYRRDLLEKILAHPLIDGARYNTGISSPLSPTETLAEVKKLAARYGKKLWIDLKGRQLRIEHWATPEWGRIELNHEIEVDVPARIRFRGDDWSDIKAVRGREIFVDPPPTSSVGQGQSVNILSDSLIVKGYSTDGDREYISAAVSHGLNRFMLSFVESREDVDEVEGIARQSGLSQTSSPHFFLKIESRKGLRFIESLTPEDRERLTLVAACDDLSIMIGSNKAAVIPALRRIIACDPEAIAASGLFTSLEHGADVSPADHSHLALLKQMGFKHFMLSDGICWRHFEGALQAWKDFHAVLD